MTQEEVVARVVEAIEQAGIPYMLVGSFASNLYGVPRMTQDADIVVDASGPEIAKLVARLAPDFYVSDEAARDAVRRRSLFNVIHLATGFKVDLVIRKSRPFSSVELARRQSAPLAGREVAFASAEDTLLTKLEWARRGRSERQYQDAVGIVQVQGERLDWPHLERWADVLGLADLLEDARRGRRFPG